MLCLTRSICGLALAWSFLFLGEAAQFPDHGEYVPDDRYPGAVEVDLIFPHNDTYGLGKNIPVVFAIQNPHLAEPLELTIGWDIRKFGSWEDEDRIVKWVRISPRDIDYSSNETFFHYQSTYNLRKLEGTWQLSWQFTFWNCSETGGGRQTWDDSVVFSTKNGSQAPNPITATEDSKCAEAKGTVFDITRTIKGWFQADDDKTCPELSSTTSAPSPCAASMKPRDVLNISLKMAREACRGWVYSPGSEYCEEDPSQCSGIFRLILETCTPLSQGRALCSAENLVWSAVALAWIIYNIL